MSEQEMMRNEKFIHIPAAEEEESLKARRSADTFQFYGRRPEGVRYFILFRSSVAVLSGSIYFIVATEPLK